MCSITWYTPSRTYRELCMSRNFSSVRMQFSLSFSRLLSGVGCHCRFVRFFSESFKPVSFFYLLARFKSRWISFHRESTLANVCMHAHCTRLSKTKRNWRAQMNRIKWIYSQAVLITFSNSEKIFFFISYVPYFLDAFEVKRIFQWNLLEMILPGKTLICKSNKDTREF